MYDNLSYTLLRINQVAWTRDGMNSFSTEEKPEGNSTSRPTMRSVIGMRRYFQQLVWGLLG